MTKIIVSFLLIIIAQENINHATASPDATITKLYLSKKALTTLKDYVSILPQIAQEDINHATASPDATITKLDLSKKGLTTLKDYNFSQYPQLEEIDLSGNDLTHIKEDAFTKNPKLRSINLSGNTKLEFPKYSTILISEIAELNLSNCGIKTLPQSAFDGLRLLKFIDLSDNPLEEKSFPTTPFNTIKSLEKVILPVENKELMKELCLTFNLTIQIKNEKQNIPKAQCSLYITYEPEQEAKPAVNLPEKPPAEIPNEQESTAEDKAHETTPASAKHKLEPRDDDILPSLPGHTSNQTDAPEEATNIPTEIANLISTTVPKLVPRVAVNETKPETDTKGPNTVATTKPVETNPTDKSVEVLKPQTNSSDFNKSEQIQQLENQEPAKVGEVAEASSTGSTILIVLVVLVVISGLAAFGYKFYKNKTARAESEHVERELKQIVTNRPTSQDFVEKEPLMNNHANKENGDVQSSPNSDSVNNTLHPHVGSANRRNSGSPYQPTTTTFKPEGTNEVK